MKTWDMMKRRIHTPAMQENRYLPLFMKKQKSKSGYESEVTVYECEDCTARIKKILERRKETSVCISPKVFWRSVRNPMKISRVKQGSNTV